MLIQLENVAKRFGDRTLFEGLSLGVQAGDRVGLVGPNGVGKTTLLHILAGQDRPEEGRAIVGRGVRVGLLRQEVDPSARHSVREEAARALADLDALEQEIRTLEHEIAALGQQGRDPDPERAERYDRLRTQFERAGGFARHARVDRVLEGLGFGREERDRPLASFSGGWLVRVDLARLLLSEPDLLLLDEPTNHLDLPSIEWLEGYLDAYRGAVVAVSHDRTFLGRHVRRIAELEAGRLTVYEGGYDRYRQERAARREQLLARQRTQTRRVREVERFVERFRAKASKARQVQSRVKMLARMERIETPAESRRSLELRIPEPPRSGERVLALSDVHKSYGALPVYRGIELTVRRGERIALVGPNGAGKSTLLRILAGVLPVDRGSRRLGHNVRIAFYAQHQLESLDASRTVLEELAHGARNDDWPRLRSHLGAFLFSGDDVEKRVAFLSGGERARLALAKLLLRPVNCLCLDEPTNHLDLAASDAVEEALRTYSGTLVFISHDRAFLNALATRVVEVQSGQLRDFPGNYDDYRRRVEGEPEAPPASEGGAPEAPSAREQRRVAREQGRDRERERRRAERRLSETESRIAASEEELEALRWQRGDPDVHRDVERVRAVDERTAQLEEEIAALYAQWERLAAVIESEAAGN